MSPGRIAATRRALDRADGGDRAVQSEPAGPWRALVNEATARLAGAGNDNPGQEAGWLMEAAGGLSPGERPLALDRSVPADEAARFEEMVARRLEGEPLQYVLGRWGFRQLDLQVDRRVLIPRPETEQLAEVALSECDRLQARRVVDLGTGTGVIALSLAVERPGLEVWATDVSPDALEVARTNLADLGEVADGVCLCQGGWYDALPAELRGTVDVIVSNPPYVAPDEVADLPAEVREWEPEVALVAPEGGLADIATILAQAPQWLARPGAVLLELAPHQAAAVQRLALAAGFTSVSVWPDLAGRDRILRARL